MKFRSFEHALEVYAKAKKGSTKWRQAGQYCMDNAPPDLRQQLDQVRNRNFPWLNPANATVLHPVVTEDGSNEVVCAPICLDGKPVAAKDIPAAISKQIEKMPAYQLVDMWPQIQVMIDRVLTIYPESISDLKAFGLVNPDLN